MKKRFPLIFFGLNFVSMVLFQNGYSQIVYTNVDPDSTSSTTYDLDLDNNGVNDFSISRGSGPNLCGHSGNNIHATSVVSNAILANVSDAAYKYGFGNEISAQILTWSTNTVLMVQYFWKTLQCPGGSYGYTGSWYNAVPSDGYLGLKLLVGGNIHYGWVLLRTNGVTSFTIRGYAYNTVPDQAILAGQTNVVLPLKFLSFEAFSNDQHAKLSWSTANEINNKGFEVQKSLEGRNFIKIGFVNGKIFTSSINNYLFIDDNLKDPTNFYRLKQIDLDNKFSYSNIITIKKKSIGQPQILITPNPVTNSTIISFLLSRSQNVSLKIFDINGRLLTTIANKYFEKGLQQIKWSPENIKEGIYFLKTESFELTKTSKIVLPN